MFRRRRRYLQVGDIGILQRGVVGRVINIVSRATHALPLLAQSGHITASHRSATKSADARQGAADGGELRQVAGV